MSRRSARRMRDLYLLGALMLTGSLGCWEQWSNEWWPQMKWQQAVQAYERTMHDGKVDAFMPPDDTVPYGGRGEPAMSPDDEAAQNALQNPQPMTLDSLENGRQHFQTFCAPCHGPGGLGDGPVSMTGKIQGPFPGVLAIAGPASIARIRSDGYLYSTIRYGRRRMPSYQRIPNRDRWDIVNYLRYLNGQKEIAR